MDPQYETLVRNFGHIGIALALGLLVGSERGWWARSRQEGGRIAGIRTFALLGLLGGIAATGSSSLPDWQSLLFCGLVFLPVATLLIVAYVQVSRRNQDVGMTTEVAAMITYWLGVLPAFDLALPAAASAVILALLLHLKETLHSWLQRLDRAELLGTLQFLIVSVVLLPLLPDAGFGPWEAFNPYRVWWMVVLISGLSLLGYFAMRLAGPGKGILATALTGGLISSTALTLSLSRLHGEIRNTRIVAVGILLACATMFARVLVVAAVLKREMVLPLLPAMATGMLALGAAGLFYWWRGDKVADTGKLEVRNPFQLVPALQFAALLALVMVAVEALRHWFGNAGLYLLSVITGVADVDAIVVSLVPKAASDLEAGTVVLCVALAGATNTLMKAVYCRVIAGPGLGWRVLWPAFFSAVLVLACALLVPVGT